MISLDVVQNCGLGCDLKLIWPGFSMEIAERQLVHAKLARLRLTKYSLDRIGAVPAHWDTNDFLLII